MDRIATRDRTRRPTRSSSTRGSLGSTPWRAGWSEMVRRTWCKRRCWGYRAFGSLKQQAAEGRWLKTILVNVFRDELRRGRHVEEVAVGDLEDFSLYRTLIDEDPLLQLAPHRLPRRVRSRRPAGGAAPHAGDLPGAARARYMDGFSTKEIARLLDAPFGTILARLHRGRNLFERTMWAYAEENKLIAMGDDDG